MNELTRRVRKLESVRPARSNPYEHLTDEELKAEIARFEEEHGVSWPEDPEEQRQALHQLRDEVERLDKMDQLQEDD